MRRRVIWGAAGLLAVAAVAAVAFDPAARVRGWVGGEPFYQGRAATAWRTDLGAGDEARAAAAQAALAAGGGDAAPVCARLLRTAPDAGVRVRAADALRQMKKAAAPAAADLVAGLDDPDPHVRDVCARAVGELAPDVPGGVAALVARFPDATAIRAVSNFKTAGAAAVPALTALAADPAGNPIPRRQAIRALGKIGEPAVGAVPVLIALAEAEPDPGLQEQAAEALGDIGPAAAAGVPVLAKLLDHPARLVRRDAARSLGQIGPAAAGAVGAVRRVAAADADPEVRTTAERAARLIDPAAK